MTPVKDVVWNGRCSTTFFGYPASVNSAAGDPRPPPASPYCAFYARRLAPYSLVQTRTHAAECVPVVRTVVSSFTFPIKQRVVLMRRQG